MWMTMHATCVSSSGLCSMTGKKYLVRIVQQALLQAIFYVCLDGKMDNGGKASQFEASADVHSENNPQNNIGFPDGPDQSTGNGDTVTQLPRKTCKKRKVVDKSDALLDLLAKGHEDTNVRLDKMTSRIGYEFDVSKSRNEVFTIQGAIPGLTLWQQFDATKLIISKVEHLDLFMCLPEGFRHAYVVRALEKTTNI